MSALVRTRVGPYRLENAVTLEQLTRDTVDASLLDPATAVAEMPRRVATTDEEIALLRAGRAIPLGDITSAADSDSVVVLDGSGSLLALARPDRETNSLRPYRVFLD
jgi:tRNA pseudouridine55 synthase